MKKYVLILLVGLLCCQLSGFAEGSENKKISAEVLIDKDTTIVIRECFSDCKLYGDKIVNNTDRTIDCEAKDGSGQKQTFTYTMYGGDEHTSDAKYFVEHMNNINNNLNWQNYIQRDEQNGLRLKLKYQELPDTVLAISLYGVYHGPLVGKKNGTYSSQGWCPAKDMIYVLNVIKTKQPQAGDQKAAFELIFGDSDITLPELLGCIAVLAVAVAVVCLFVLTFVCINKLSKKINRLSTDVSAKGHETGISREDIYKVITGSDVQRYIQEIVAKSIDDYIKSGKPVSEHPVVEIKDDILAQVKSEIQTIIAGQIENYLQNRQSVSEQPAVEKPSQISEIKQPEFRTTKVQYYPDSNSFIISENSQNEIFELYSENGEYYYTIVNDPVLRKEMLGILPSYRQCIEIRQDSPTISDVEVIRDGKLIKNGDVYNIDSGCVLQLSLK